MSDLFAHASLNVRYDSYMQHMSLEYYRGSSKCRWSIKHGFCKRHWHIYCISCNVHWSIFNKTSLKPHGTSQVIHKLEQSWSIVNCCQSSRLENWKKVYCISKHPSNDSNGDEKFKFKFQIHISLLPYHQQNIVQIYQYIAKSNESVNEK